MDNQYANDDPRRSAAAQFFLDENGPEGFKIREIVNLINEAVMIGEINEKLEKLQKIQALILSSGPDFLERFLPDIVGFQSDRNAEVRRFVVGFIEEAFKRNSEILPQIIGNIQSLVQDTAPRVQKRVVQCVTQLYRHTLMWLSKAQSVNEQMQTVWSILVNIKAFIINMVDSDNDGLRTQIVKFLEMIVLLQTYREPDSTNRTNDFSLEDVPLTLKVARRRKLEEEAMTVFDLMLKFHGSPHISSANLMACMGSLTTIAKLRPNFMGKVVAALETLHMNLPPTLSTSQVNSVRKHLKVNLLNLLKHPSASEFQMNITTLLTDLGATTHEVMKAYPKLEEGRKRSKKTASSAPAKKVRLEEDLSMNESAIDITETFITERLTPELAANLVIMAMNHLPETMPSVFNATYTPIAAAGTQAQIKHVARLLATQLNAAGLGPGATIAKTQKPVLRTIEDDEEEENGVGNSTVPDENVGPEEDNSNANSKTLLASRTFKQEMYKPMSTDMREFLQVGAVQRILSSEESAITGGVSRVRSKILASFAASFGQKVKQTILNFIMGDIRNQINLALAWIYEEYSYMQGFTKRPPSQTDETKFNELQYDTLVTTIMNGIIRNKELKERDVILTRICLEMPLLTDEVINLIKNFSTTETLGLSIIYKLVLMRPMKQLYFLNVLLDNTSHQASEIREASIGHVVDLYPKDDLQTVIEEYAIYYLGFLKLTKPPEALFGLHKGRPHLSEVWTDDSIKACLYLYLSLLPINQELIHELSRVYIQTQADVKRTILRVVEYSVKAMGMDSPQLLKLVEECPKGSETLVTRIIHILTDKSAPSAELVDRVRELYRTRVSDVRFLIPVLNGLKKGEIIEALPKLIKLNPVVVKEVFNRLLGTQADATGHSSPITPAELLTALHLIDPSKCELKTVIKATSLCFSDKEAYTQEVLAVVLQHLMEVTPLPTLLMRTVIQALSLHPRLIGFVMNILQRLISKQVWKQKKVWEGFIKCCQRTQPASFQVLLQLPPQQLIDVFREASDLRKPLLSHIMEFTENQRAHIPQNIMDIIKGQEERANMDFHIKEEPLSPASELTIDIKEEPPDSFNEPAPPGLE
ncbi:symplekin isoform X1 [Halyomorpha halys]|uniref:symplekin isoform X1 n=1 Tax=Halyomorpha halys TaxID=286706 RepID=UPI0006D4EE4C|nr:symplekin isoform X1 [Halyomorpha halys]